MVSALLFNLLPAVLFVVLTWKSYGWWQARGHAMYMGLILVWSSPILAIQWLYGGTTLVRDLKLWAPMVAIPTVHVGDRSHRNRRR